MATIVFDVVGQPAAAAVQAQLTIAAQNTGLRSLFKVPDPASLHPEHGFQVFTVSITNSRPLGGKDVTHSGSGCLLVNHDGDPVAGIQLNPANGVESLEFGSLFTGLLEQAKQAASATDAPPATGTWALLQAPELHARALFLPDQEGNRVWPLQPMPHFLTPKFYTMEQFLAALSSAAQRVLPTKLVP